MKGLFLVWWLVAGVCWLAYGEAQPELSPQSLPDPASPNYVLSPFYSAGQKALRSITSATIYKIDERTVRSAMPPEPKWNPHWPDAKRDEYFRKETNDFLKAAHEHYIWKKPPTAEQIHKFQVLMLDGRNFERGLFSVSDTTGWVVEFSSDGKISTVTLGAVASMVTNGQSQNNGLLNDAGNEALIQWLKTVSEGAS